MTPEEIAALPIGNWADTRSHLYLWSTQRYLRDAFWVGEAWGFEIRKVLVWCKAPTGFSMGGAFGNAIEFIVIGVRDGLPYKERISRDWFDWKRGAHSEKPNAFYQLVELMSFGPYLDVFARKQRMGWDTFGDEAYNFGTSYPPSDFVSSSVSGPAKTLPAGSSALDPASRAGPGTEAR